MAAKLAQRTGRLDDCASVVEMLNNKLSILKRKGKLYGGVHVLFAGDFRQLKPVKSGECIYHRHRPLWDDALNTYIELDGLHRFAGDSMLKVCSLEMYSPETCSFENRDGVACRPAQTGRLRCTPQMVIGRCVQQQSTETAPDCVDVRRAKIVLEDERPKA